MRAVVSGAIITGAGLLFLSNAATGASASIAGDWVYPDNGSVIRVYKCAESFCAKIIKVKDPSSRDVNNPDPRLRNRPIVGVVIATKGVRTDENGWIGNLYNPMDGQTYRGTVHLLSANTMTVVGCIGGGVFCDARTLMRSARRVGGSNDANTAVGSRKPGKPSKVPPQSQNTPARRSSPPIGRSVP